jgi:hypothetical protein
MRFRVSVYGYEPPDELYTFQVRDEGAYYLSSAFTSTNHDPTDLDALRAFRKEHRFPWYGTLQMPKIKIPAVALPQAG